jgi:hypothetical protein
MTSREQYRALLIELLEVADRAFGPEEANAVAMGVVMRRVRNDVGSAAFADMLRKIIELDRAS